MSWQQLLCDTSKQYENKITQLLEDNGAVSVTFQDAKDNPVLEPKPGETPLWDHLIITGLFDSDKNLDPVIELLHQQFPTLDNIRCETLEEQQWERSWMDSFQPMKFGNNLWIYPTHSERPDDGSTQILLDPGLAFGTGTHPTTALCLEWLDNNPPKDLNLIDYGCGSGILAIAAIKLGARHVVATDIDHQALTATNNNMQSNGIADNTIRTCLPENLTLSPVDIVIANILSGPLTELAPKLAQLVIPKGRIVLSGILIEQKQAIILAYTPFFTSLNVSTSGDWLRVTGTRIA